MRLRGSVMTVLVLLLGFSLVFSACGGQPADEGDTGDTPPPSEEPTREVEGEILYGMAGDPVLFNTILNTDIPSAFIIDRVFNGLVEFDENLEPVGDLAESWEFSEDGLEWTFHLREGVKWHDGEEFTAEDVKWTYDTIKHPDCSGPRTVDFQPVVETEIVDDYTVKLTLEEPYAPLLEALTVGIMPEHIFGETEVATMREHPANQAPIGTGPYKWGEWVKGQYLVLEANENYFEEGPWIARVRLQFYQDTQVMLAALENGDIDYMGSVPPDDVERVRDELEDTFNFYEFPNNGYTYIGLKQTHPILQDKRVRAALMYGINRAQIIEDVFKGLGTVMNSHYPPFSWAYTDDVNEYEYETERAIGLLEEAGWTEVGDDGIRRNANGDKLEFVVVCNTGNPQRESVLLVAQEQLKEIGVNMKPEFYEWSVLLEQYLDVAEFEAYMCGWSLGLDPDPYTYFHSVSSEFGPDGFLKGFNDVAIRNDELDRLIEEGRTTLDHETRKGIYQDINKILNEELPYIFLYTNNSVTAMHKRIQNVTMSPLGPINPNEWYIEDTGQ